MQEIEDAIRFKLGRFADEDGDWDLKDTNDFLEIIRELKRQIFNVFREAGNHVLLEASFKRVKKTLPPRY